MASTLRFLDAPPAHAQQTLEHAVREGLTQTPKTLPCRFFYDEVGSGLFEQICELPEYYPTRTERALFERWADAMIARATGDASALAMTELGSGSSCKTRLLIEAALRRQDRLVYTPIDISGDFLHASAQSLLREYHPALDVTAIAAEYSDALRLLPPAASDTPQLFLFLGSNIGNFERPDAVALLCEMRARLRPDDRILIGVDCVKEVATLEAAYNDVAGVTAAFNKNLLTRINRELGADFALDAWTHAAPFVQDRARIEMWLRSDRDQTVTIPASDGTETKFLFRQGEGIHTENSHKYTPSAFESLCAEADLQIAQVWSDDREWFSVLLLEPAHAALSGASAS